MNKQRLIDLYFQLVRIPSMTGQEGPIAAFLAEYLERVGLEVELVHLTPERPSLIARTKETPGPSVLLSGHLDTVPVLEGWKTDPFEPLQDGNKVYGLGACDMKGGLAAMIESVHTLLEEGTLGGTAIMAFTCDEELNSEGTYQVIERGLRADHAIVGECRFDPMVIGYRGRYSMELTVQGESAHASRYPKEGRNALITASKLAVKLDNLATPIEHPLMGRGTPIVRWMEAGNRRALLVPDSAKLYYERYVVPGENKESVWQEVEEVIDSLGLRDQVLQQWTPRKTPFLEPFAFEADTPVVQALSTAYQRIIGREPQLTFDPSVCDANYLGGLLGIPTCTFGPSGQNWHAPNEFGYLDQVVASADIYAAALQALWNINR